MREFFLLSIVVIIMHFISNASPDVEVFENAKLTIGFGFLLVSSYFFGLFFSKLKLPKISGYITAGIVFGPFVLNYVQTDIIENMKIIDELALTLIALNAGGELKIKDLKKYKKSISLMIIFQTVFIFVGMFIFFYFFASSFDLFSAYSTNSLIAFALITGALLSACSPASAFAIIQELESKGPFTDIVLGVTVAKDIIVIILFGIAVSLSNTIVSADTGFSFMFFVSTAVQILSSAGVGIAIGLGVSYYIKHIKLNIPTFLLVLAFLIYNISLEMSHLITEVFSLSIHFEPLLIAITAGFYVQNYSKEGPHFIETIENFALPVYVLFFAMSGVIVNIDIMINMIWIALIIVSLRMFLLSAASYSSGLITGDNPEYRKVYGLGFITQAGVSLGLANEVMRRFPEWGETLGTLIIAIINLNQIVGPITFKYALQRVKETKIDRMSKGP